MKTIYKVVKCPTWFSKDFDWAVKYRDKDGEDLFISLHIERKHAKEFANEMNKIDVNQEEKD